jgi:hypothetical protein
MEISQNPQASKSKPVARGLNEAIGAGAEGFEEA